MKHVIASFVVLLSSSGCSLMGLDDFTLKSCMEDDDCLVFNEYEGLPESCNQFYCQDGACLRRSEGQEIHDQQDNDCDGLIDEPSQGGEQTISVGGTSAVTELSQDTTTVFAADSSGGVYAAWWDEDGSAWFAPVTGGSGQGLPMSYQRGAHEPGNVNGNTPNLRELGLEPGAYKQLPEGVQPGACDFSSLAIGLASDAVIVASINREGCVEGQLRLGYFERGNAPDVIMRGPLRRSNTYLGVDVTESGSCSGGSRPGCTADDAPCGVKRPSLAVLERQPRQALVAWTGDTFERRRCGGDAAPVEIIAAFVMQGELVGEFGWLTGSNEGIPQSIGSTNGGGPPSVVAIADQGYLVAFGNEDGNVSLHFVPAAVDPPEYDGYSCPNPCDFEDRSDQLTQPISDIVELADIESPGGADYFALALGASRGVQLEVGVAWLRSCGSDEAIAFRRVVVETNSDGAPSGIVDAGEVVTLSSSGASIGGPPAIVYASTGFVTEGFERSGEGPSTTETDGGWLVAWVQEEADEHRLVARRVLELDGLVMHDEELIDLTTAGFEPASDSPAPALSSLDDTIRFSYHDREGKRIIYGSMPLIRLIR